MAVCLPVEIELENQKFVKVEVDLQRELNHIEHECITNEEFDELVVEARVKMTLLKTFSLKFQNLVVEWEDDDAIIDETKTIVQRHKLFLQSLQSAFYKSCINGKKRLKEIEKESLFSMSKDEEAGESKVRQRKTNKREVANKAGDITQNLLDIARLMDNQVRFSEDSNSILEGSSQKIKETNEEFKGLTGIISMSRKLLNKYNRRELTDTLLLFFGLILFFATVIYIISKRI